MILFKHKTSLNARIKSGSGSNIVICDIITENNIIILLENIVTCV